jgi:hypothetical protein
VSRSWFRHIWKQNGVNFTVNWSNGYAYRRALTIDHTKAPNTNQANFPVLISGTIRFWLRQRTAAT